MRKVISVATKTLDTGTKKDQINAIVAAFDRYLDDYPVKTARTKHGVMGPVARILDRAKAGGYTEEALIGDAMRVHEMNPKARGYLKPEARQNLAEGTHLLLALCGDVPMTSLVKVIDQIDYSLYYARRTKGITWLEEKRQLFSDFLRTRYPTDEALRKAWTKSKDVKRITLADAPFPRRTGDDYGSRDPQRKADIDEFWASLVAEDVVEPEDEEVN